MKVYGAAKRDFDFLKTKLSVTRRVKCHVEKLGMPWKLVREYGSEICQISVGKLNAHIDNHAGWGDGWYPPSDMEHVAEYVELLRSILRIERGMDSAGTFVWHMQEAFHALLPGFVLVVFGKLMACKEVDVTPQMKLHLVKVRSGNAKCAVDHQQCNVYIDTRERHPLLGLPPFLNAKGMVPNTMEVVKQTRENRFCYLGTPSSNVGMAVFEFGSECGLRQMKCVFADIGVSHPFTRTTPNPPELYSSHEGVGGVGPLGVLTRERKAVEPHNVPPGGGGKIPPRRRKSAKSRGGGSLIDKPKESQGSEVVVDDSVSLLFTFSFLTCHAMSLSPKESETDVEKTVMSLAEWTITNNGFLLIAKEHRWFKSSSAKAKTFAEVLHKFGETEFGVHVQNIEDESSELYHPLDSLDNCFSCEGIYSTRHGRVANVYFVSGEADLTFRVVCSNPTFAHMAKIQETCSVSQVKDAAMAIRVVGGYETFTAKKGEFVYVHPKTLVKVSLASGSLKQFPSSVAVEIFSVSFGSVQSPRTGSFEPNTYPTGINFPTKRHGIVFPILGKSTETSFEVKLLSHLFQFPGVGDFLLPSFRSATRKDQLDHASALKLASDPPFTDGWKATDDLRQSILLKSGFTGNNLLSSLSLWTLNQWIVLANRNPNKLFNEIICLDIALQSRDGPDKTALLKACALLAESFPRVIPSFERTITRSEMYTALKSLPVGGDEDMFDPRQMLRGMLSMHPHTQHFEQILSNDWTNIPASDREAIDDYERGPHQKCVCIERCGHFTCNNCDSENWCTSDNCSLTAAGKNCSNNPSLFTPLGVCVGYSGNPQLHNALYATEACLPGRYIGEYTGVVTYEAESEYAFIVDCTLIAGYSKPRVFIDSSRKGSPARFANHSHGPTCIIVSRFFNGKIVIWLQSIRHVFATMELTFDYGDEFFIPQCLCGSYRCPGSHVS